MSLQFTGRVAIISGAGRGLGATYARELAKRGALVVVNDLDETEIIAEINNAGGKAVYNGDSVEDPEAIVKCAIDNFGKVDIVINNAGMTRDQAFHKMTKKNADDIFNVHLRGSFFLTQAAWPHFREAGYGRVINTASGSGLYGNFGQANYSAAKLGLHGLTQTLSKEGAKYNIKVNTIAPVAASRLTKDILPPEIFERMKPEMVMPIVLYLAHEKQDQTGQVYEVGGGYMGKVRWQRSGGKVFKEVPEIEEVEEAWETINSFGDDADNPSEITSVFSKIL